MSDEPAVTPPPLQEIYRAMEKLGAPMQLLSLIGSYGDTLPDEAVLMYLRAYNDTGTYRREIVCQREP